MLPETGNGNIYFVGICGTGMSSLAVHLASQGHQVEGSDDHAGYYTADFLLNAGIRVHEGFSPHRFDVQQPVIIIYSAAFDPHTHCELISGKEKLIPCLSYPQALGILSRTVSSICVSGTHGKTTTSIMILMGLRELGIPAAPLIGSPFPGPASACDVLVIEACEYRKHFLLYSPDVAVITSVDHDHVDCYPGIDDCRDAFTEFAAGAEGALVIHSDAGIPLPSSVRILEYSSEKDIRYSVHPTGRSDDEGNREYLFSPWKLTASVKVPGGHIAEDALAAMAAVSAWFELQGRTFSRQDAETALRGISSYQGAPRRFEHIGEASGVLFYDDYAHHPKEIEAVLKGVRQQWPDRRLVVDFVPHTLSRTKFFLHEFASALSAADAVILQEIYASQREHADIGEISSADLAALIQGAFQFPDYSGSFDFLKGFLQSGDLFITMGAGDNRQLGADLLHAMQEREAGRREA